mmetsp:Transcript_19702/g.39994  ORF Transcript_19702/g.39994 Transcript_19702/m.39994 type:complete len:85 (+) Transcript_19702:37-291(+)
MIKYAALKPALCKISIRTVLEEIEKRSNQDPGSEIDLFNDEWDVEDEDELMKLGFELRENEWLWSEPQDWLEWVHVLSVMSSRL